MAYTHDKANYINNNPFKLYSDTSLTQEKPAEIGVNHTIKPIDRELATAEIERNEIVFKPTGELYRALGNKHRKGTNSGTPVNLPDGSFIFSDHKPLAFKKEDKELFEFKVGGKVKNNTPAKTLQKEVDLEHHNRMIAIQDSNDHDAISKTSAQLMLQKNMKKIGQVAYLQEEYKGFPDGLPDFSNGTAPIKNEEEEAMQQQYQQGGFTALNQFQRGGKKKGYGNIYGPKYTQYTTEHPENFNIPAEILPFNLTQTQHQNPNWGSEVFGSDLSNEFNDEFKNRHDWYFKNPSYNPKTDSTQKFQQAYNAEAQRRGYDPYFVGKAGESPRAIDGKFGEYTRRAPGFKGLNIGRPPMDNMFPFGAPEEPKLASPVAPTSPSTAPLVPQTPTEDGDILPYEPNVGLNNLQRFSLASSAYNLASAERFDPKRQQVGFTPLTLEKVNSQPYMNALNNQTQQAYRANQVMNPILARAQNSNTYGRGLEQASDVLGKIDNQNLQISNQENIYNNQGINRTNAQNVSLDGKYYDQVTAAKDNYKTETGFLRNRLLDEYKGYRNENKELELQLASQPTFGTLDVYEDPKTGEISKTAKPGWVKKRQAAPLYDYNNKKNKVYFTGAGMDINQIPAGSTAGLSFSQLKDYATELGLDARGKAYIFRDWAKQGQTRPKK
jgi:hypothetical protein